MGGIGIGALIGLLAVIVFWLLRKFPITKKILSALILGLDKTLSELREIKAFNTYYLAPAEDMSVVLRIIANEAPSEDAKIRAVISVYETSAVLAADDNTADWAAATYFLLNSKSELAANFRFLVENRLDRLEVKKVTLVFIDVLGQLFDLEKELDSEYFQHLIYALNQVLIS